MIPDICHKLCYEQDKECQICATRALRLLPKWLIGVNVRLDAITSQTTDALGLTALCDWRTKI
jgi:hypothetical protein